MDTNTESDLLTARAEFYLCLSRAFLVPGNDSAHRAMQIALADDLDDLANLIGYPMSGAIARYRESISCIESPLQLLQIYSGLFLAAPRIAHINTAVYLDGTVNGGSVAEIEREYRRHGLTGDESLHDLPDHAAVQLEFVATLFALAGAADEQVPHSHAQHAAIDARDYLARYVARWIGPWIKHLDEAAAERQLPANPYAELARILEIATATDSLARPEPEAQRRRQAAISKVRRERAARGIDANDLVVIAEKLRAAGLSTEHLALRSAQLEPKAQRVR